ncbi:hypothetical protein [Bacillus sp. B1-b2]|uniref:hypothetical protein n=1 Tax=Bacillus sp. B1-b2 TaxID=2653201 RepID=UPI0012617B26|nr:hypothetical protein [Bacillus sp. B1-b2]KAB7665047.1 hypothetical protein F9279_21890 [Bacillus sp. B1-b2]
MKDTLELYTYEIINKEQIELLEKAAECLARTFIGVDVSGKWVQEPMVGLLNIQYEDFYHFTKDYLEATVEQGYCAVAIDSNDKVVGVLAGDTNAPEIIGEDVFEGSFSDMNVILHVLEDVDKRFLEDYQKRNEKELENGEILHLFMLGVIADQERHEIIKELGSLLILKATADGLKAVVGEATNPKSMRVMEKYHGMNKYVDLDGNFIVHKYQDNSKLNGISSSLADGTYIIIKEL